ncbi:MAG: FtsX-like permease family protein [Verrucomicrobiota bacterium]
MKAGLAWLFLMAWRDSRRNRRKLTLFALSVVFGIAALVAVNSFSLSLENEMERQSKDLLGADLEIRSNEPLDEGARSVIEAWNEEAAASEIEFTTMALFPKTSQTRLVRVKGMEGRFPLYGTLDTVPAGIHVEGAGEPVAIIEESIRAQFGVEIDDEVKIGEVKFRVIGEFLKLPGETMMSGTFAPRILIPMEFVEATNLVQFGSRVRYREYLRFNDADNPVYASGFGETRRELREKSVRVSTIEERQRDMGRTFDRMSSYLNMVGFVALLLGGVGIAGGVQVYLKSKVDSVALLRCGGASVMQSFAIFCIQIFVVGSLGILLGVSLGVGMRWLIPVVAMPFLPFELPFEISWASVWVSLGFGAVFTALFSMLPLLPLRKISPLRAIRSFASNSGEANKDWLVWLCYAGIAGATLIFTLTQTRSEREGGLFVLGLGAAIGVLAGVSTVLRILLRKISKGGYSYAWKQGLANLHRPNNRTLLLVVTLGMGAFLIFTLYFSEQALLDRVSLDDGEDDPNIILFDIQPDQKDGVEKIILDAGMPIRLQEPIVTMRLSSVNGVSTGELRRGRGERDGNWALTREYRSTYRGFLREDEVITSGEWIGESSLDEGPVPISIEQRIVEALSLKVGDKMEWNVQGLPVETYVASIRDVDWEQLSPNFFVLFPSGVLEAAPAMFITATRGRNAEELAYLQRDIIEAYPNVSAVDLSMLLGSLKDVFDKVRFVISFMASFTILTGIIVLISTILTSRYQRMKESVLLRTMGASARQVRGIMSVEYLMVGVLAALTGGVLSLAAAWGVTKFVFEIDFSPPWFKAGMVVVVVSMLTLGIGLANSVGIAKRPPLEALRRD